MKHLLCQSFKIIQTTTSSNDLSLSCQLNHSSIKHATERAPVCEQSASRGETCGPGPVHAASYYSHGCCHIQPLVSKIHTQHSQRSDALSLLSIDGRIVYSLSCLRVFSNLIHIRGKNNIILTCPTLLVSLKGPSEPSC